MVVVQALSFLLGAALATWVGVSALTTVVLPRAVPVVLTRAVFIGVRKLFDLAASERRDFASRDRVMALYAPTGLVVLAAAWAAGMILAFTAMFWSFEHISLRDAFIYSGSSLTTLGFAHPPDLPGIALSFLEATIGLGLVALLVSYLPSIYAAFSRREMLIGMLEVRAGLPPSPGVLLARYNAIGWLDHIDDDLLPRWEEWFVDIEESHTSQGSLVYFRSSHPGRSWITAAGCVLDTAALVDSVLDRPSSPQAALCLRSGFLSLRRIADFFGIPYNADPAPDDPITVTRREFDLVCVELTAAGIALKPDRDQAFRDFAGWRVNYDTVLRALASLVMAPEARWVSDLPVERPRPRLSQRHLRHRRRP